MEQEKQKTKNLLEKEIKKESEYFFEEVKKEPLDEEYFEQNVPKLEEVDEQCSTSTSHMTHFVQQDSKLEDNVLYHQNSHANDFSQITQKRIFTQDFAAQNSTQTGIRIPILIPSIKSNSEFNQKPFQFGVMSDQSFDFSSSWKQNISACDPVQRNTKISLSNQKASHTSLASNTLMDHVKLKPIDDDNYDFQKMPNIRASRNRNRAEHLSNNYDGQRCHMCLEKKHRLDMKYVTMEEDKLVLMIGYLLRNDCTLDQAKQFMSRKWSYICHSHFSDAIDTICEALHIKNYEDIDGSSDVLMQNLMTTVNALNQEMMTSKFCDTLNKFASKNFSFKHKCVTRGIVLRRRSFTSCSVCSRFQSREQFKSVTLLIMVGCVVRGDYTLKKAQNFMKRGYQKFICHNHFSETIHEIFKVLDIKNLDEIHLCSEDVMQCTMVIVSNIYPFECTLKDFDNYLHNFVKKYITFSGTSNAPIS